MYELKRMLIVVAAGLLGLTCTTPARAEPQPAATQPTATQPASDPAQAMPGITVNREAGYIDLDANVAQQTADWLELLACSPDTREYESVFTVPAKPQHIHLALLMLNLEPGSPLRWEAPNKTPGQAPRPQDLVALPPLGPKIAIDIIYEDQGQRRQIPASAWIRNQQTGKPMTDHHWLFAGSVFKQFNGQRAYMADLNGNVISLVNFGDDLLAKPTSLTNQNDDQMWTTMPEVIPPVGTKVTLRLTPIKADQDESAPQTQPQPQQ